MNQVALLHGEFVPESDATLSIFDGGWLHGAGLFETMRAEQGRVFRLEEHIARLRISAERLLLPIDRDALPSGEQLSELLRRNELAEARVRLTVSAGNVRATDIAQVRPLSICVTTAPLVGYAPLLYERGVPVMICPFRQNADDPLAGHKTTCYLPRLLGLREASKVQCHEAIWFTSSNELAEGSISNIFVVRNGVVSTPPKETPVLPGIARAVVLELAREFDIETRESKLYIADLLDADECFLTNVVMQVMPVVRVERRDIGNGTVGPITKRLLAGFREKVIKECKPS